MNQPMTNTMSSEAPTDMQPASDLPVLMASAGGDPKSARSWSGTPYYMTRALEGACGRVDHIPPSLIKATRLLTKAARAEAKLTGRKGAPHASWGVTRMNALAIRRALSQSDAKAIFAPAGSTMIAALNTDGLPPIIYTSDATVRLMKGYYGEFTDLEPAIFDRLDQMEQAAIDRSDLILYPTEWAARSAIEHYNADPAKVHVLPYGANLDTDPDRSAAMAPRSHDGALKLLFVGVDWERKGGDIAVSAVEALNARGVPARLTVLGCTPPERVSRQYLDEHPFIDKNDPEQAKTLSKLYFDADLLFVPTRAECYGLIWCEAAAHGLPSIANATGGVPDVVKEGVIGHTLPPTADGAAYADLIAGLAADPGRLTALGQSARTAYENALNWTAWAQGFRQRLEERLSH